MIESNVDYTIFFRELSAIPKEIDDLKNSFYVSSSKELDKRWMSWLHRWRDTIIRNGDLEETQALMRQVNPSITWREWLIAPAYQQAEEGDFSLVKEIQEVFQQPYETLPAKRRAKYDRLKPRELFNIGGISHYSCSS